MGRADPRRRGSPPTRARGCRGTLSGEERMAIARVGVGGCGRMRGGLGQVGARAGYATTVVEADQALLDRGLHSIDRSLDGLVDRGRLEPGQRDAIRGRLTGSVRLEDLGGADLV